MKQIKKRLPNQPPLKSFKQQFKNKLLLFINNNKIIKKLFKKVKSLEKNQTNLFYTII